MAIQKFVIVKTQFEALHQWKTIPTGHPSAYLKNIHRHMFHIEMRFLVNDSDRQIEFFDMRQKVNKFLVSYYDLRDLPSGLPMLTNTSCEMIGETLLEFFKQCGCRWVQVLEDGEMGAIVEVTP